MEFSKVSAISPIDGRYRNQTESLAYYFSEAALINYRVFVEIEYFIALCNIPLPQLSDFDKDRFEDLRRICRDFTFRDAKEVKQIERITNHDVKAAEYYIKRKFDKLGLTKYKEFIHFGLTSQDVTNTAIPYAMKLAVADVIMPAITKVVHTFNQKSKEWKNVPMLSRTHGQPASPTYVGKEIRVFTERLRQQIKLLNAIPFSAKLGGAIGNFNAHHVAYPDVNWSAFADNFIKSIGLQRLKTTTQIEHYDNLAAFFDGVKRINTILIDFNRDIWSYISLGYFKQKVNEKETGSSTMPHKVNPIDFENSEGNLGIANALFEHLSTKLPVSRMQRDLTDSTVTRVIGTPFAHSLVAYKSLLKGLNKLILNKDMLKSDLENHWVIISEAIQTILRREGYPKPYEALKDLTRKNEYIDQDTFTTFINKLKVPAKVKEELKQITPHNYTGVQ